jgi:hypothetical protein
MPLDYKLPTENVAELRRSERTLNDLIPFFDKSEQCGIECQELRVARDEAAERIAKLLQHFA